MKTSIHDFDEQTCQLFNPLQMFVYIHHATKGDPCTTGCAWYQDGECPGYKKLHDRPAKIIKSHLITNSEIAKQLNCSKRKVAKTRKAGTLPEKYL